MLIFSKRASLAQAIKNLPAMWETQVQSLGKIPWRREWLPTLVLAWRIPWAEETDGWDTVHEVAKSRT